MVAVTLWTRVPDGEDSLKRFPGVNLAELKPVDATDLLAWAVQGPRTEHI